MAIAETLTIGHDPLELGRAAEWLDGLLSAKRTPPQMGAALHVAMEEVLNNILCHADADLDPYKIEVRLTADESVVTLEFFDDGIPFDPTQPRMPPPVDTEEPDLGDLGQLFVQHLMDEVVFERVGGRNHLTIRKFVPP